MSEDGVAVLDGEADAAAPAPAKKKGRKVSATPSKVFTGVLKNIDGIATLVCNYNDANGVRHKANVQLLVENDKVVANQL